uniref:DUF4283 domain-containing protein n=1 Tax=Cannabis sativa TaxID=3483 RepID=A0A803NUC4_CANSA
MASSSSSSNQLYDIAIEDETKGGLDLQEWDTRGEEEFVFDWRLCLLGGFITAGTVDFPSMQLTLAALWKPGKGVYIKELDANRFLFQFFHEIDIKRVIEGSPWDYMRIRVTIDLSKPLKRRMRLRKLDEEWFWITFKYENVPTFCFICEMLGYSERFCARLFDTLAHEIKKPYGECMRALLRRRTKIIGAQWLRTGLEGDMNNVTCQSDKRGGRPYRNWLIEGFQSVLTSCGLIDMEMEGYKFTWERGKADWGREITGNFQSKISQCKKRIKLLKGRRDTDSAKRYKEENERLAEMLTKKEIFWRQRSKQLWLKEGDHISKYFHAAAKTRKQNNRINSLRNDSGTMVGWDDGLQYVMVGYFQQLFTPTVTSMNQVIDCIPKTITPLQNLLIVAPIEECEVKKALFQMHPDKSWDQTE